MICETRWRLFYIITMFIGFINRLMQLALDPMAKGIVMICMPIIGVTLLIAYRNSVPGMVLQSIILDNTGFEWDHGSRTRSIDWNNVSGLVLNQPHDGMSLGWGLTILLDNEQDLTLRPFWPMKRRMFVKLLAERYEIAMGRTLPTSGYNLPSGPIEWGFLLLIPICLLPLLLFVAAIMMRNHAALPAMDAMS